MPYVRKTVDVWVTQGYYSMGWEDIDAQLSFKAGKASLKSYNIEEPIHKHRLIKRRERKEEMICQS